MALIAIRESALSTLIQSLYLKTRIARLDWREESWV